MKTRIAAATIAFLLLLLAAYATRYHYEHGPKEALFRINRYTGETCRLTFVFTTPEPKTKTGNENPFDELLVKPKTGNENPLDEIFKPKTYVGPDAWVWADCGK